MKITVVIVTFNRLNLLKKTLTAVKNQTIRIDQIVVVNNSSTDGTETWLESQNDILTITQENTGGAGGFESGIKNAIQNFSDWIWVMDDDVFPQKDALENLLVYKDFSLCIQPRRIYESGDDVRWGGIYNTNQGGGLVMGTKPNQQSVKDFYITNTCCFEGMLIHRELVDLIGYPDKNFFISGDDTAYGLMATQYTNIILVNSAILEKAGSIEDKKSPMYIYYLYRNFFHLHDYHKKLYKKNFSPYAWLRYIYGFMIIFKRVNKKDILKSYAAAFKGLMDGLRRIKGKNF